MNIQSFFRLITIIQKKTTTFSEVVEILYGVLPPENNNFLGINYAPHTDKVIIYGPTHKNPPLFSIIIPTHNRHELLQETLIVIAEQKNISKEDFELVIVDNASEDRTEERAAHFGTEQKIRTVFIKLRKNFGPDLARNVGVLHSSGELLAFTDDDCLAPDDWLSWFREVLSEHPETMGAGGWKEPYSTTGALDIYHRYAFWTHQLFPPARMHTAYSLRSGYTANVCYRKADFEKIGGFNTYFKHAGFYDFPVRVYKSGLSILYEPRMVKHRAEFSFKGTFQKNLILGWDYYLLHLLYPSIWKNITFFSIPKRTMRYIRAILSSPEYPHIFKKTASDIVGFSILAFLMYFCFWFGKYWISLEMLSKRRG